MAEREVPRRLMQQQLEVAPTERTSEARWVPEERPLPPPPASTSSSLPPTPSDLPLRERQRRWLEERARFERTRRSDAPASSSK